MPRSDLSGTLHCGLREDLPVDRRGHSGVAPLVDDQVALTNIPVTYSLGVLLFRSADLACLPAGAAPTAFRDRATITCALEPGANLNFGGTAALITQAERQTHGISRPSAISGRRSAVSLIL